MSWHNGSGDKKDANFVLLHKQPGNAHFLDEQDENDVSVPSCAYAYH